MNDRMRLGIALADLERYQQTIELLREDKERLKAETEELREEAEAFDFLVSDTHQAYFERPGSWSDAENKTGFLLHFWNGFIWRRIVAASLFEAIQKAQKELEK